jgi:hypothetical protein
MPVPPREEAARVLQDGHETVVGLMRRVSDEELIRPATIGGGDWSAKDLLGHLTTWEEAALEALTQWRAGETPSIETEVFASSQGVDAFNARTVEAKARLSLGQIRRAADEAHRTLLAEIESMGDEEWSSRARYPTEHRRRLAELLGSILGAPKRPFGHAFAHVPDLEAFVAGRAEADEPRKAGDS